MEQQKSEIDCLFEELDTLSKEPQSMDVIYEMTDVRERIETLMRDPRDLNGDF